ncbi:pyroglutamyl-peptidase I [Cupriavidus pauculus]|uniref:Pyrrolidone-carboxylate peptidase n=1 Tax=Cupriavidus pauculus TaxID=82633 RepID=A0A2N5CDH4_9BURK|nr:pyroglutamyl-peptidase I [Cupriavidus pauculus]PLQ00235.1 pyroglutamyl-peptidase I [Cupriavidus pauculus]
MQTVLVTGIEPFDGETLNPSWESARTVDGRVIGGARVVARQLPCVIAEVRQALLHAIKEVDPVVVLCLGQAGGRADVSVERVAINVVDARIPDNAGRQPVDEPVIDGGPVAYFSALPIKALVSRLRASGIPASVSQSAGTYNCNAIFYSLLHYIATERPALRGGFIHVPYLPQMAAAHPGAPSMDVGTLIAAIEVMVATTLEVSTDLKEVGGATH